jgi:hypothetical protein
MYDVNKQNPHLKELYQLHKNLPEICYVGSIEIDKICCTISGRELSNLGSAVDQQLHKN